jgi:hypothetical protein
LLVAGCGEPPVDPSVAEAAAQEEAKRAAEAAQWKPPEVDAGPPVQEQFSDIDEAWAVLSLAGKKEHTKQIWAAIDWLAAQGQPAQDRMTGIMNDRSADVADRLAATMVLGEMGNAAKDEIVTAALTSDLFNVRMRAAESLGKKIPHSRETVDALLKMLDEEQDTRVMLQVVRALAEVGEPAKAAAPKLLAFRDDLSKDDTLRNEAHLALKKVDPRRDFTGLPLDE